MNFLVIHSSYAQTVDYFKPYTNNDIKFSIQYPSDWEPEYSDFKPDIDYSVVYFGNIFQVGMEKVKPYLDTDTLTLKNTSLQQYIEQQLNSLSSIDAKIIRQNEFSFGGNAGWKIEYTLDNYYEFQILTFANGYFYMLSYKEDQLKVPETLPLANRMVESLQIYTENRNNNLTSEEYRKKYYPEYSNETQLLVLCSPEIEETDNVPSD